jgi:hypothetical protein
MLNEWLVRNLPHFIRLATLPFDQTTHKRYVDSIGWISTREKWWPESCFKVRFDDIDRDLVAVYKESEAGIAIGLYALTEERVTYEFAVATRIDFDKVFFEVLATIAPVVRNVPTSGTYNSQFDGFTYRYAYWRFAHAFITLVQHFQGDGNFGHDANLDLFIVPRLDTDHLQFPLETNILF